MQIKRAQKLYDVKYEIRGDLVARAAEMEQAGENVTKLNIGNLAPFGFDAPREVISDMNQNLHHAQGYTESRGIFSARKAIMQYYQLRGLPNLDVNDIYLGNGSS